MTDVHGEQYVDGWLVVEESPGMEAGYGVIRFAL